MAQEVLLRIPGSRTAGCVRHSRWFLALVIFSAISSHTRAEPQWAVRHDASSGACVLESSPAAIYDGYQESSATMVVSPTAVYVVSRSVFDPTFGDMGMQIDRLAFIPVDDIEERRRAVFKSHYEEIVRQFKAGSEVNVDMRFWPTWPAQGRFPAHFSLMGFTKAYEKLLSCR